MFTLVVKFGRVVAFGGQFVMVMFGLGKGRAAAKCESQCEENDGDGSEFHFFTLSTTIRVF